MIKGNINFDTRDDAIRFVNLMIEQFEIIRAELDV